MARLEQLEAELAMMTQEAQQNKNAAVLMHDMVNAGVLKEEGENSFLVEGANGLQRFDYQNEVGNQ